jgi:hypothetical protein
VGEREQGRGGRKNRRGRGEGGVYRFWGTPRGDGYIESDARATVAACSPVRLPVSGTSIKEKAGAAIRKNGKTYYYGRVPSKCPKGGFPGKGEVTLEGGQTITTELKVPCPKRSLKTHHK